MSSLFTNRCNWFDQADPSFPMTVNSESKLSRQKGVNPEKFRVQINYSWKRLKMMVCMTHFDWKFVDDWLTKRSCFTICSQRKLFGPRMMLNLWQTWAIAGHQSCPHRENICNKISVGRLAKIFSSFTANANEIEEPLLSSLMMCNFEE